MDSGSGSEHAEEKYSEQETEEQQQQQPPKKKRYHRHTAHQIQEMEKYDTHHNPLLLYIFSQIRAALIRTETPHWEICYPPFCYDNDVVVLCLTCSLFKECPHPDDKQRQKLSLDLGLKPRQVKFWFQNRRTQMKVMEHFLQLWLGFCISALMEP